MGLESVRPSYGSQIPLNAGRTARGRDPSEGRDESGGSEGVRLSDQGRKLSRLADLLDPTRENVRKLSTTLADNLKRQLARNGIDPRGAIEFDVDAQTGKVNIKANRPDATRICALLDSEPELERQLQDVAALSRHVVVSEQDARANGASQSARSAAQLSSFSAHYASHAPHFGNGGERDDFSRLDSPHGARAAGFRQGIASYSAMSAVASTVSLLYNGADVQVRT